jgi:hypothetical protein
VPDHTVNRRYLGTPLQSSELRSSPADRRRDRVPNDNRSRTFGLFSLGCTPSLATITARAVNADLPALGDYLTVGIHHLHAAGSVVRTGSYSGPADNGPADNGSACGSARYTP